jgi:hypothetical protein
MHYSGLSFEFLSCPHSPEPIIYIIENDKAHRGTGFSLSGVDFGNIVKFGKRFGA